MADPATIAMVGMGASAAQGIVGAFGSIFSGNAQANMYQYQAGVARINETIARQNAAWERQAGEAQALEEGLKGRQVSGRIVTAQSGSGFDVRSGTNVKVQQSQSEINQYDQNVIRANAAHRAYSYEVEAVGKEAEARADEYASSYARTAGYIGAVSSILGGASSVSSKYLQMKSSFGTSSSA